RRPSSSSRSAAARGRVASSVLTPSQIHLAIECTRSVGRRLWVQRTGAPWHDLPSRYPAYQTCHRRFQAWQRSGRFLRVLQRLAEDLQDRGKLDLSLNVHGGEAAALSR